MSEQNRSKISAASRPGASKAKPRPTQASASRLKKVESKTVPDRKSEKKGAA